MVQTEKQHTFISSIPTMREKRLRQTAVRPREIILEHARISIRLIRLQLGHMYGQNLREMLEKVLSQRRLLIRQVRLELRSLLEYGQQLLRRQVRTNHISGLVQLLPTQTILRQLLIMLVALQRESSLVEEIWRPIPIKEQPDGVGQCKLAAIPKNLYTKLELIHVNLHEIR